MVNISPYYSAPHQQADSGDWMGNENNENFINPCYHLINTYTPTTTPQPHKLEEWNEQARKTSNQK